MYISPQHSSLSRVLIVEDSPTNVSMLAAMLKGAGMQVEIAVTGAEAIASVEQGIPALILLDIGLPDVSGFDLCRQFKNTPATADIPIIFMTALTELEDKIKGLSIGAVDYITKPFQPAEVLARIRIHMELRSLTCKVMEQATLLAQANHDLQRLTRLDSLTQVANRRWFDEYILREWRRLARDEKPLSIIFCDVDSFKAYNDHYGHLQGDSCLQKLAHCLEKVAQRPADLVARYGGEEFVIVLPDTSREGAVHVAEAIQTAMHRLKIPHAYSETSPHVTVSLGLSTQIPQSHGRVDDLVEAADRALYVAKQNGRNTYHAVTL